MKFVVEQVVYTANFYPSRTFFFGTSAKNFLWCKPGLNCRYSHLELDYAERQMENKNLDGLSNLVIKSLLISSGTHIYVFIQVYLSQSQSQFI